MTSTNLKGYPLKRAEGLLLIADTPKGRAVFASTAISKNTIIETSPVLIFTPAEVAAHTTHTVLQHYTYYWPDPTGAGPQTQAIALGLGSMFNHSRRRQNVVWSRDVANGVIVYVAARDVEAGEELCISYGSARLWFRDADGESDEEGEGRDEFARSGLGALELVESNEG